MCLCVSLCVCSHFQTWISLETSGSVVTKFYLKHHWVGGRDALGFGPDWIRTLVFIATDSSHRIIMGKRCEHASAFIFDWIFFMLTGNEDNHNKNMAASVYTMM